MLAVHRLHNGTGRGRYARWIAVDDVVRIHGYDLRRICCLVLKLNWRGCLRLNRSVVVRIRVARAAVAGAVIGTQREIVICTALSVVLLAALMMVVMRVVYAATVLYRTRG